MSGWFSVSGIQKEAKRIRWPKWSDIGKNTAEVLVFVIFFALFFTLCGVLVTYLLRLMGIGAQYDD